MRLNRELRTRSMVFRFHLLWVAFYILLILAITALAVHTYNEHNEDSLPAGSVELKVNKSKYQLNENVKFQVINHFPTTIYVTNNCPNEPLKVYKWQNDQWKSIHDKAKNNDSQCYKQPRNVPIESGSSLEYSFSDWPNLFGTPGVYRIVMDIDHYDYSSYQDFVVLEPVKNEPSNVEAPTVQNPRTDQSENQSSPSPKSDDNNDRQDEKSERNEDKYEPQEQPEYENDD